MNDMELEEQTSEAMQNLIAIQELLGGLGFTLTGDNTYYKDYALIDGGIVRIVPVFDRGMSLDVTYKLVGFNLSSNKFVPVINGSLVQHSQVPSECWSDVNIITGSVSGVERKPMVENFMITAICSECNTEVNSFMRLGGRDICLKCQGHGQS